MADATLFRGGSIRTMEPDLAKPEALAVLEGRIVAVGGELACRAALPARPRVVDLRGGCLLPGFIDTHLHPIAMLYFEMNADLRDAVSIPDLQQRLAAFARQRAADEWIVGLQLDDEGLAERRLPTRQELDAACPGRAVVLLERDGHTAVGSSLALARAGIGGRPDPPGGHVARDPSGAPTGTCHEAAAQQLLGAVPTPDVERLRESAGRCFGRLARHGITSVGAVLQTDAEGPAGEAGRLEALAMQLLLDEAPFSVYSIPVGQSVAAALALRETPLHDPPAGHRVGGFKIFADGTFGACTACVSEPFADSPASSGYMTLPAEEILARMRAAHASGLQICVHAIGDEAIRRCLDLYERLLEEAPRPDHRHRIEHASLLPPELVQRIARLGLAVSTQPLFIASEHSWLPRRLGLERVSWAYPLRGLLDAGVLVGGASDAPIESTEVLRAVQCCVTRHGFVPEQSIPVERALALFTRDAARLQFEEDEKGRLVKGARADLVVLAADPLEVPVDEIAGIPILETFVGGRRVKDTADRARPRLELT